ncbi:MAG: carbon storage regulator, partial [Planctomycetota bacterium]
ANHEATSNILPCPPIAKESAMLILSRKVDQEILIGDDVRLTVVRIDANRVRIGIEAPDQVRILRGEIATRQEDRAADPAEKHPRERRPGFAKAARNTTDYRLFSGRIDPAKAVVQLKEHAEPGDSRSVLVTSAT